MACAKLWPDCIYKTNIKANIIFTKFHWWVHKPFVKWFPEVAVRMIWTNKIYFQVAFQVLLHVFFFLMHHISCDINIHMYIYTHIYLYPTNIFICVYIIIQEIWFLPSVEHTCIVVVLPQLCLRTKMPLGCLTREWTYIETATWSVVQL